MAEAVPEISATLIRDLLRNQFPQWQHGTIEAVPGGWDHRTFRLGEDMLIRLPSADHYAAQVIKESQWLPVLAPRLPIAIPEPLALASPSAIFPRPWAVNRWIDATPIDPVAGGVSEELAQAIGEFLQILHTIELPGGPGPGAHSFGRGGPLATYDAEVREALTILENGIDVGRARSIWDRALGQYFDGPPAWLHGDVAPSNLLARHGRLFAAIDWGLCAVGDPSCDLAFAWTSCEVAARQAFRAAVNADDAIWARGQGWALWKTLKILANFPWTDPSQRPAAELTLRRLFTA